MPTEPTPDPLIHEPAGPDQILRPLRRVRQTRQFTPEPLTDDQLDAIVDVGRWSGSSRNGQPWRFIVLRDAETLARIGTLGAPSTRSLDTAAAAIAVSMPVDPDHAISLAFDEGRAAERMLIAAALLGLAAAIAWVPASPRPAVAELLGLPPDRVVRTMVVVGHPTPEAVAPKSPGTPARLPRSETVYQERWPSAGHHDG